MTLEKIMRGKQFKNCMKIILLTLKYKKKSLAKIKPMALKKEISFLH